MKKEIVLPRCPLDLLANKGKFGLIALATDFNIENDFNQMFPNELRFFTTRVLNVNPLNMENLRTLSNKITEASKCLLPGTNLDAIIFACTSGTIAIGSKNINELVNKAHPNIKVITPVSACLKALQFFAAVKISILTPYSNTVNNDVAHFFSQQGFDVLNITGFDFEDDTAMTFINPQDIVEAAINHCDPKADALFISCTALRATAVIAEIEQAIGKPVITSNQAMVWECLKSVNYNQPIEGFGRLLSSSFSQH